MESVIEFFIAWCLQYRFNIIFSIITVVIYLIFRKVIKPKIEILIERDNLRNKTLKSALLSINIFSGIVFFVVIILVWGIDIRGILAVSTGIIAITGVALFANWSILSNITAFFILLTQRNYKVGNYIRVIDLDNYIEGEIVDISLINTKLVTVHDETIIYPNNLLVAKPTVINPKNKSKYAGKIE